MFFFFGLRAAAAVSFFFYTYCHPPFFFLSRQRRRARCEAKCSETLITPDRRLRRSSRSQARRRRRRNLCVRVCGNPELSFSRASPPFFFLEVEVELTWCFVAHFRRVAQSFLCFACFPLFSVSFGSLTFIVTCHRLRCRRVRSGSRRLLSLLFALSSVLCFCFA
jgi:hypothetical protein